MRKMSVSGWSFCSYLIHEAVEHGLVNDQRVQLAI